MARSIRWRLVMGTMLLTLLTVSAVGVVALLLMQRYMVQQERAYLASNAEAIANQAVNFMTPVQAAPPLQQLAQTAAFLGDVTVRIVDEARFPLADSASPISQMTVPMTDTMIPASIAAAPIYFQVAQPAMIASAPPANISVVQTGGVVPNVLWTLNAQESSAPGMGAQGMSVEAVPALSAAGQIVTQAANIIVVQRSPSIWGNRLTFEAQDIAPQDIALDQTLFTTQVATQTLPPLVAEAELAQATYAPAHSGATMPSSMAQSDMQTYAVAGQSAQPSFWEVFGFQMADVVTAPIQTGGMTVGYVELGRATDLTDEPLGAIRQALTIAAGASSLLAIAVGLVMSRTLTAPIQNLAQAALAMSSGDLTARAPVVGHDELASLARQFNHMADALHSSFVALAAERDTLRRFVADASHELRTPITALRTFNELLQGPAQQDRAVQAEFLAESDAQIARLEWITRNLLDLSRWDGGMATLSMADVDVGEVMLAAAAPLHTLAQERDIALRVAVPPMPVVARVDAQRLEMAVGNLLDNALKFTPSAGRVEVGVVQAEGRVTVWVADTGMGIEAEALPHIFERFYRSPRATQAGSGLGLAIVAHIVNAHGATLRVESAVGAGSCFTLCLGGGV